MGEAMQIFLAVIVLLAGAATVGWFVVYAFFLIEQHRHAGEAPASGREDPVITHTLKAAKTAYPVAMGVLILSIILGLALH